MSDAKAAYAAKLRDPRWRKRREYILNRDGHACRGCGVRDPDPPDDDQEEDLDPPEPVRLEVHHKYYEWGKNPWEYPDSALITLCQQCHDTETEYHKEAIGKLTRVIQTRFLSKDIFKLTCAFQNLCLPFRDSDKAARIIAWVFQDPFIMSRLENAFDNKKTGLRHVAEILDGILDSMEDFQNG